MNEKGINKDNEEEKIYNPNPDNIPKVGHPVKKERALRFRSDFAKKSLKKRKTLLELNDHGGKKIQDYIE